MVFVAMRVRVCVLVGVVRRIGRKEGTEKGDGGTEERKEKKGGKGASKRKEGRNSFPPLRETRTHTLKVNLCVLSCHVRYHDEVVFSCNVWC